MIIYLAAAFIYLLAAVVAVPVANRLGLGSVLGYLIAGVMIGPVLGVVGAETETLQQFAEFGVVMMLFLIGLEVEPKALWQMRHRLFGLGGLQVLASSCLIAIAAWFAGLPWQVAMALGLILSLSSTAIVLQTLGEKDLDRTEGGRSSFAVLLFQDIAVIPMFAILPLLALPQWVAQQAPAPAVSIEQTTTVTERIEALVKPEQEAEASALADRSAGQTGPGHQSAGAVSHDAAAGGHGEGQGLLVAGLPAWGQALVVLASIGLVIIAGARLSRPLFRFIAASRMREIFTAAALMLVIGIALLMALVGLSPALGAFVAGVVLANSEYRHELESDIAPFKGLLLGLFFITVGAGIDFTLLADSLVLVLGLTVGLILLKAVVLLVLGQLFGLRAGDRWLLALSLAQAGEFCFVLLAFSLQNQVLDERLAGLLSLVVALSMLLTPLLFILQQRIAARARVAPTPAADEITEKGNVIIAGHGRFGQVVNRMLVSNGHKTVVLDHQPELVDGMRKFGVRTFYGDASRPDLLHAAGLARAAVLVVAIDDPEQALAIVTFARRERPDLHIVARAFDRQHVYRLYQAGANDIVRETFDSAVRSARYALIAVGEHPFRVEKASRAFVRHDRETVAQLARLWNPGVSTYDNQPYIDLARERLRMVHEVMATMDRDLPESTDRAWAPPPDKSLATRAAAGTDPAAGVAGSVDDPSV